MTEITKTLVTEALRPDALPKYFGKQFLQFEMYVYTLMSRYCPDYLGGYWDFYSLSNGGFFMSLHEDKRLRIENPDNFFDGQMSPEAASVAINLLAINRLEWSDDLTETVAVKLRSLFEKLRDYAFQRDEASAIARFID